MALLIVCTASKSEFWITKIKFQSHLYSRATRMFAKRRQNAEVGRKRERERERIPPPPNTVSLPLVRFFGRDADDDPCLFEGLEFNCLTCSLTHPDTQAGSRW